jgi:hypothetical protein
MTLVMLGVLGRSLRQSWEGISSRLDLVLRFSLWGSFDSHWCCRRSCRRLIYTHQHGECVRVSRLTPPTSLLRRDLSKTQAQQGRRGSDLLEARFGPTSGWPTTRPESYPLRRVKRLPHRGGTRLRALPPRILCCPPSRGPSARCGRCNNPQL